MNGSDPFNPHKITIFGAGYVGLTTGVCLAEAGNEVCCVDVDRDRVARLNDGDPTIYEPGLEEMLHANQAAGRLTFSTDLAAGVDHGLFQFIAVGTPPDARGAADLRHVLAVAEAVGRRMAGRKVVVNKSTVPVGTADRVRATIDAQLRARGVAPPFDVVSNPEFLKEGAALNDFLKPDRIVIGSDCAAAAALLRTLYAPFNRARDCIVEMDVRSAELTKYAANAMLAARVSFMNEMAHIAERVGADIEQVRLGIGSDRRIGCSFLYPGIGYGGSCFPKDVRALQQTAAEHGCDARILGAVEAVNEAQKRVLFERIDAHFDGALRDKTIALWGLAFKPNTDDMREAPSRPLLEALWEAGATVRAYDPEALESCRRIYGARDGLILCDSPLEAARGADALAIATEWKVFHSPDFAALKEALASPALFDGRNLYDPARMAALGFVYCGIGRAAPRRT